MREAQKPAAACRVGCGACCIAPAITSAIPGMSTGKPAGTRCVQLSSDNRCRLFGHAERPSVCDRFVPDRALCGDSAAEALMRISLLEGAT